MNRPCECELKKSAGSSAEGGINLRGAIFNKMMIEQTAASSVSAHTFAYNGLLLDTETIARDGITSVIDRSSDAYGRPTGFLLRQGYGGQVTYSVAYGYDTLGRFNQISNFQSQVSYSYLPNSDLISQLTTDNGLLITRSYEDHRNLLTQVKNTVDATTLSQYDYVNDNGGRRISVKYSGTAFDVGNSFNLYGYNTRSEVQTADRYWGANLNDMSDPVPGQSFAYGYDPIGNRQFAMRDNEESIYTANNLNQYLQRTVPGKAHVSGSAAADATVTVNSEPVNRHNKYWHKTLDVKNTGKTAYPEIEVVGVYNPETEGEEDIVSEENGHIFVPGSPEKFKYDADGNMTQDGRFNYSWDCENRLIGVETRTDLHMKVPRVKVTFQYDYMGRRVMKHVSAKKPHFKPDRWLRTSVSTFLYDGWNVIAERKIERKGKGWAWGHDRDDRYWDDLATLFPDDECEDCEKEHEQDKGKWSTAGGSATGGKCKHKKYQENYYVHGLDLSGSLQGAGGVGGLQCMVRNGTPYYPCYDANGNITEYVDTNGVVVAHREYDPFGNTIVATGPMVNDFNFWFSTKYLDQETGLYYYGYRYYSPSLGRWLSRDPIGEEGGINLLHFVGNNPQNFIDKLGLKFDNKGKVSTSPYHMTGFGTGGTYGCNYSISASCPKGDPCCSIAGEFEGVFWYIGTASGTYRRGNFIQIVSSDFASSADAHEESHGRDCFSLWQDYQQPIEEILNDQSYCKIGTGCCDNALRLATADAGHYVQEAIEKMRELDADLDAREPGLYREYESEGNIFREYF